MKHETIKSSILNGTSYNRELVQYENRMDIHYEIC